MDINKIKSRLFRQHERNVCNDERKSYHIRDDGIQEIIIICNRKMDVSKRMELTGSNRTNCEKFFEISFHF